MRLLCVYLLIFMFSQAHIGVAQQSEIDSLETIIARNANDAGMANALNEAAIIYNNSDTEKSIIYAWRAKTLSKALNENKTLTSTYALLVNIYKMTPQQDSTDFYLAALKDLAVKATGADSIFINQVFYSSTGLYYKTRGKTKEALPYLLKGYEYSKAKGDKEDIYGQAINIGNCYYQLVDYKKSLEFYFVALKGFEIIGNKAGKSFCYNNISNCYYELNRFSDAISYLKKSIIIKTELGDKRGLANTHQNFGNNYMGLGDYKTAKIHFEKSIELNKELNNVPGLITNYYNLARMYPETDPETALLYFAKSMELAVANKDSFMIAKNELEIMATEAIYKEQLNSESSAILNVEIFKESGRIKDEFEGYKSLAEYYTQRKQFDKALEYTKKYHLLNDSIKSNEILARFKSIEEAYNKEKNEKQIALLQKDQEINARKLKQQRSWMLIFGLIMLLTGFGIWMIISRNRVKHQFQELELRNNIAADLHDEVGSSLSSIYMLSQMAGQTEFGAQVDILSKVKTNAFETIEKMSDIVWMIKSNEDTYNVIERMRKFGFEICGSRHIAFTFLTERMENLKLSMLQNKNLYLIFKEAINNAVKYSGTDRIEVFMTLKKNNLKLIIQDFGKGFEDSNRLTGNGLDNMTQRALTLSGRLKIDSNIDSGVVIELNFPYS